jgi:plasmid stabilization system protein ParE
MLQIVLTDNARFTLQTIFDSIENKFSAKTADEFLFKVEKTLILVAKNPEIYKASPLSKNVRVGHISKQTSFYYQINNQTIVVLYFWDNRQDPISF